MHFLNWVLDQKEEPGDLGLISAVMWADINNGCGLRYTSPVEWNHHFDSKHKKTSELLNGMLTEAFILYANRLNEGE